jgi:hypothetical protein
MTSQSQLPQPPFHSIPGLPNCRDLGGWPLSSQPGRVVRHGVVLRSSEPSQLTEEGIAGLRNLGIRHVYDLRSVVEIERGALSPSGVGRVREWEGAQRSFVPVFLDQDYSPEAIALRFRNYASEGSEVSFLPLHLITCLPASWTGRVAPAGSDNLRNRDSSRRMARSSEPGRHQITLGSLSTPFSRICLQNRARPQSSSTARRAKTGRVSSVR